MRRRSTHWWTTLWFLGALALTVGLVWATATTDRGIAWLLGWLIAASSVTTLWFGIDKVLAKLGSARIPERTLWLASFVGGSPGAWLGMRLFRHKTAKESFQRLFRLILILQAVLLAIVAAVAIRSMVVTTPP